MENNGENRLGNFPEKGVRFLEEPTLEMKIGCGDSSMAAFHSRKTETSLNCYLGENSKHGSPHMVSYKGKEIIVLDDQDEERNTWVERDFVQLSSSKRVAENEEIQAENRGKKPKAGSFDVSLSLTRQTSSSRSVPSVEQSSNKTRIGYYRNGSLSSYSHPFSHNLSFSLTMSSSEDSVEGHQRRSDQIRNYGDGFNWSVHSQFRPVEELGDFTLSSHPGGSSLALGCRLQVNKEICDSDTDRISSSDSNSFFPFELPARPIIGGQLGDSRVSGSSLALQPYGPERILGELVSESIPLMAQIVQELPHETVESTKEYLRSLIAVPQKKDKLVSLQNRLNRRSDLTIETLSKCNRTQLEIFVAIKMGLGNFLSFERNLQVTELMEIFSLERCRNIYCKRVLALECDCKLCATNKGFCKECMCQVCFNFDNACNTSSWIGCDVCIHWCHTVCAIQRNLIKSGPSMNMQYGTIDMQFHCLSCGHASDLFGFAKDVYMFCAKAWGEEILTKELDYVRKLFHRSEDFKGKELYAIAYGLCDKLEKKIISLSDARNLITQFFNYTEGLSRFLSSSFPASIPFAANSSFYIISSSSGRNRLTAADPPQIVAKNSSVPNKMIDDECSAIK